MPIHVGDVVCYFSKQLNSSMPSVVTATVGPMVCVNHSFTRMQNKVHCIEGVALASNVRPMPMYLDGSGVMEAYGIAYNDPYKRQAITHNGIHAWLITETDGGCLINPMGRQFVGMTGDLMQSARNWCEAHGGVGFDDPLMEWIRWQMTGARYLVSAVEYWREQLAGG